MRKDKPPQSVVAGNYSAKPHALADLPVYRLRSLRAKAVLDAIQRDFNGWNNGRIGVSMDQIAERIGSANHKANREAIAELVACGLIVIEKIHPRGSRKSDEYRLTYASTGDHKNPVPPTQEYSNWEPGDAGTVRKRFPPGKKSPVTTATRNGSRVVTTATDGKLSVSTIATREAENADYSQSRVVTAATLIGYQSVGIEAEPSEDRENSGRHFRDESEKPASVPDDRWIMAGKRAAENPAGPDAAELRQRVADYIEEHGRGSQTRLAKAAGILGGTLSKFINGDVDLTNRHRVALACSMLKAAAAEEKLKPRAAMESRT